jgi:diacylglycerol kinase (ATP)
MAGQNLTGIARLNAAWQNSLAGLKACWTHEEAFRQEVIISIVGIPLGFYLGETPIEQVLLIGSLLLLMIIELLNSAVEAAIDRIGMERHELSGRAKDIASAAVLLAALLTGLTWFLLLI